MTKKSPQKPKAATTDSQRSIQLALAAIFLVLLAALGVAAIFFRPWDDSPTPTTGPAVSPDQVDSFYMPAEFHPQEILLLAGSQLAELHPDVLAGIIKAASSEVDIRVLVGSSAVQSLVETILVDSGLPPTAVDIMRVPIRSMWVRDFGPLTVSDAEGRRSMVKFHYRERRGNTLDDGVPTYLAVRLDFNLLSSRLLAEGGDYLSNGRGLCLLSTRMLKRNTYYLEMESDQTMADFAAILGFETLYMVPPLQGESTGHADMFCAFLKPDLLVVGRYDPAADRDNAAQLDQVVAGLEEFPTLDGPLKVERMPMPDHDDDIWRTYTNIVFANNVVLVPVYPDYCPELDETALNIYRRLLPDRRIVGIDCSRLIKMKGALRCITMNVPSGLPLLSADVAPNH